MCFSFLFPTWSDKRIELEFSLGTWPSNGLLGAFICIIPVIHKWKRQYFTNACLAIRDPCFAWFQCRHQYWSAIACLERIVKHLYNYIVGTKDLL